MSRPASMDLRERVVSAVVEDGMSRNAAAARFGVGVSSAIRWVARFYATGRSCRKRLFSENNWRGFDF